MVIRSRVIWCALLLAALLPLAAGPAPAQSRGAGPALSLPGECATLDRPARELLFGFPFDPGDCSGTSTNPSPDYDPGVLYEIPVVVHIIMDDTCTQGVVSDDLVDSQIEILNEDFLALPGTNGENGTDAQIRFVLASEDPDGNPTDGITRDCNTLWYEDEGEYWNTLAWDPHEYLNIYTNTAAGARGYVPFLPADGGGNQVGELYDRVVINWLAFGRNGPFPPHDQGRTATHEVGHYLGLEHTFHHIGQCGSADPPACYEDGDLICDTLVEESSRDGCQEGAMSCGSLDPIHNYMDYSDDLCLDHFTLEQSRRLRCTLESYRPDVYDVVLPLLAFDPASLDFGDVEVGTTSPPQTVMLTNSGDADATEITFSGLPDAGFSADTSACGGTLPAGASCGIEVTFAPAAPGPATATLTVDSDQAVTADLGLAGSGIGGGEGPIADITPDAFSFEVPQGGSDSETLNVGNLGDADLTWSLAEAEAIVVPEGAPYRYDLAEMPAFNAPVGYDRASNARLKRPASVPADPVVLPAPQPAAIGSLTEGFDDITTLPGAGWALINNSEPLGPSSWFQGNPSIFPAHQGDPDAYIAANYESTSGNGDISNWLITPEVTIVNGTTLTFWTRKSELFEQFADRMEVRMSVEGASTDVGDTAESVGDFTTLLLTINPELIPGEYPQEWTSFTVTVRERSREPVTGRFAFRYWVTDSGPEGTNGDYIGIDTVSVTQGEPPAGGCANPLDIPWLSADPTSGTTPPSGTVPVEVTVDTADLEIGEHTARLCVTTNDPAAPLVEVPVSLTVTGGEAHFCDDVTTIPDAECRALVAIYETNGGENWDLPGWLEDLDPCTWGSVVCGLRGGVNHVVRLQFLFTPFTGDLAPEVGDLSELEILQILFNGGLTGLPDEIGNLAHLQRLAIEFGQLSEVPATIGQLGALTSLELSTNQLTALPDEISALTALEHIQASTNQITALPESIGALGSLDTLLLQWNQIAELPASFSDLQSLQRLDLSGNPLGPELPGVITELAALQTLIVTDAGLAAIPDAISNLQDLVDLQLYFNEIEVLPEALAALPSLENFGMSGNQISEVPDWVGELPSLLFLRLADNQLTVLPASLAGLGDALEVFDASDNQITGEIPEWLGTFSEMYTLLLANNELSGEVPVGLRDGTSIGGDFSQLDLFGNGCLTSTIDPTFTAWLDEHAPGWDDGCAGAEASGARTRRIVD